MTETKILNAAFVPSIEDYWRALILYGKNQSTYKMALAQCLIRYSLLNRSKVTLDELADDFFNIYAERMKSGKPQGALIGKKTYAEQAVEAVTLAGRPKSAVIDTVKEQALTNMVLQKFHTLHNEPIPKSKRFYELSDDHRYLVLFDNTLNLFANRNDNVNQFLQAEITARWDLLEHAFEDIHKVESLDVDQYLEHVIRKEKRTNLTKLIPMLEGYQRGRCFYCNEPLHDIAVDHVIPYQALMHNEFWNLVLADSFCNENKSDNIPSFHLVENLISRNEFFIASAHPLKNTLIRELGSTENKRRDKILKDYSYAKGKIVRIWGGNDKYDPKKDPYYRSWSSFLGSNLQQSN